LLNRPDADRAKGPDVMMFDTLTKFFRRRATLFVMRLSDMHFVHPGQITSHCSECGEEVGIYPSGQRVMRRHRTTLICHVCADLTSADALAPGAEDERFQSVPKSAE